MQKIKYKHITWICLCFFVCTPRILANIQDTLPFTSTSALTQQYPFIAYDSNYLHIPLKAMPAFDNLFGQLHALKKNAALNSVQIFHLGDSHIQADFFSNRIRNNANNYLKFPQNCFRNFVFPYAIAKTNSLTNYRVNYGGIWQNSKSTSCKDKSDMGITGIRLETKDGKAWLHISRLHSDGKNHAIASCKVYHNFGEGIPYPVLRIRDKIASAKSYPDLGYTEFQINTETDSLLFRFERGLKDTHLLYIHGFEFISSLPTCYINNFGVNGASLSSILTCNLICSQLQSSKPNLIVLSFGTNDVYKEFNKDKFMSEYAILLDSIYFCLPSAAIILTTPADFLRSQKHSVKELKEVADCIKELAQTYHCAYWDLYEIGGAHNSIEKWYNAGLANKDKLHFLKNGYQVQADLFFDAFYKVYSEYINKQLH